MGQIAFSKDNCINIFHPICSSWNITWTFLQKEMGIYVPSPWAKWTFVSASTNSSERNHTAWLPRLGHEGSRESIWLPCSQSTHPWNSATMLWGSPGHMERPRQQPAPTARREWKTFSWGSKHREQRQATSLHCTRPRFLLHRIHEQKKSLFHASLFWVTSPSSWSGKEKIVLIRHLIFFSNNSFFNFSMRYI